MWGKLLKNLFKYLKYYTVESILGPLFKLLEAMFELFVPLVVADIIDYGIKNGDKSYIFSKFLILIALGVIGIVCSITAQYFAAKASVGCSTKLRRALFAHVQELSFSDLDRIGVPTLITRLTGDINQVQSGLNLSLRLLLRSPFVVFGAMVMAFTINKSASLIFLAVIAVLAAVVFGLILGSVPAYKKVQGELDTITGITRESLTGSRVIRAFGMENSEREKFAEHNGSLSKKQRFAGKISALTSPMTFVILNIGIILLLNYSGIQVNTGSITTGQAVALYNYMTQILVELIKFANLIISISKFITCMNRIDEIIETEPAMAFKAETPAAQDTDNAIEFRSVDMKYTKGADAALSDISFTIKKGETVGIIGGTGCGKTTLVSMIPRFYDATEGEVLVDGVDVRDYDTKALRSKIGVVSQKKALFAGTVRDNIRFGKQDATDEEIWQALETAQAKQMIEEKSGQLDFVLEQEGKNLSGGQRQRMTIARALVRKPEVLILDDAASALDYATGAALNKALRNTDFAPTVITVSQRVAAIRNADTIVVLDEGEIVGMGTNDELLRSCEVYKEIFDSQLEKEDA